MTVIIFLIVLSILVFVHEFGHFWVAKKKGLKVEEFGFGFPPRLFGIKRGETIYSLNLIPFGGFVKIFGEDGGEKNDPRSFSSRPPGTRSLIAVAGVVMNFLLAMVLLVVGNFSGLRIGVDEKFPGTAKDLKIQIIQVADGSPAASAGIKALDEVLEISFQQEKIIPSKVEDIQEFVKKHLGKEVGIKIKRNNEELSFRVLARREPPPGQGSLGISLAKTGVVSYPWHQAILNGIKDSFLLFANTVYAFGLFFKSFFVQSKVLGDVAGPIGIAVLTGQAAGLGLSYLLQFIALLSVNLAVLNLIPFPALDGGRILLYAIEKARGVPLSRRTEGFINAAGFIFLLALMFYVTVKDVIKFF